MGEKVKKIEEIYDDMEETISDDIGKDSELKSLWEDLLKLEEELNNVLNKPESEIFNDYISKQVDVLCREKKLAFKYGYNLSNNLMIESLRE